VSPESDRSVRPSRKLTGQRLSSSNDYFLFFLVVFFAFFAFLAMLPSVIPNVWLNARRQSTCIDSDYTKFAKLILRGSKRVNDRLSVATGRRASRDGARKRGGSRSRWQRSRTTGSFGSIVD